MAGLVPAKELMYRQRRKGTSTSFISLHQPRRRNAAPNNSQPIQLDTPPSLTNQYRVISNRDQAIWASLGGLGQKNDFRMDVMASVE
jgi:hypothetical protein